MKSVVLRRKSGWLLLAGGGLLIAQSSAGGCLPNNYFADLGGAVIEAVATTVALDALGNALNPATDN